MTEPVHHHVPRVSAPDARSALGRHHGGVTNDPENRSRQLPPDPEAYDSPRAELARKKGLEAPYIAGGEDPEPEVGRREERYYGKLLLAMVIGLILGGFVLGIVLAVLTGSVS